MFFLLFFFAVAASNLIGYNCSEGLPEYEIEILKTNLSSPYMLAIDYDTNTLFFSYSADTEDYSKSAYLNLETKDFGDIPGIKGGFANAVDKKNHKIYLGGTDGIYEFDQQDKQAKHLGAFNHSVYHAYYKEKLYYTSYPDEVAYTYEDGLSTPVESLIGSKTIYLVFDKYNNMFVANSSGLFCFQNDGESIFYGEFKVNSLSTDSNSEVYFSTLDAIYKIDNTSAKKIFTSSVIFGVAVESDGNIIASINSDIARLRLKNVECILSENNSVKDVPKFLEANIETL